MPGGILSFETHLIRLSQWVYPNRRN